MNNPQKIRFNQYLDMAQENLKLAQENEQLKKDLAEYQSAYKLLLHYHCLRGRVR